MSQVKFIGCLHLGHQWIAKYRGFTSAEGHDEYLIEQWNSVVHKKDLVYILGDITMETNKYYYQLDKLNGRKIVVLGNHDLPKHTKDLLNYVESVSGAVDYKGCLLTHVPIHPNEISFYKANIHAHIHHKNELDNLLCVPKYGDESNIKEDTYHKYINVDAYLLDFKPKTLKELGIT